ncbi:hypothetical protein [Hafnia phage TS33]|nr:hypothetical protein [Hafnia phage TS33]
MKLKSKAQSGSNQEHALLSPSASKKWLGCPAALACEFGIPNESGQAAVNGTAMHSMAEYSLNAIANGSYGDSFDVVKWFTPNETNKCVVKNHGKGPIETYAKVRRGDVVVTDDFVKQVDKYVSYCRPITDAAELFKVEYRVNLTKVLHPGVEVPVTDQHGGVVLDEEGKPVTKPLQTFGTADLVALSPNRIGGYVESTYTLIVVDLKTGRHKVSAKENKQMMLYALGILRALRRTHDITAVRLVIFQPYAGGADEWDTTPEALEQFGKYASASALKAIDAFVRGKKGLKPADFRPSNDACQWCRFAEKCNAKRKLATIEVEQDLADESDSEMTLVQLKAEWDKLPFLRQHIADTEKAMYAALMRGDKVEGLKLVEGRPGNRAWGKEVDEVQIRKLLEMSGMSLGNATALMYKKSLLSPTEMEKAAPKEAWEELKGLVTRKDGQPSIAPADDKRAEYTAVKDDLGD